MHDTRFRPTHTVRASISNDGLVLLDLAGGLVLSSNTVGGRIWRLIEQRRSPVEIVRQLSADYGISDDRAQRDVTSFVAALVSRGLISEDERP